MEVSHYFSCPYCWQSIDMMLDVTVSEQNYIQDCEVCCNPIEIVYSTEGGVIIDFEARQLGQ